MIVNEYEKTYVSVQKALWNIQSLDAVVEFLRKQTSPVSCKEIGTAVFGPDYSRFRTYPTRMGQILRHLRQGNFIKVETHNGDPIEIEVEDYVPYDDENEEPFMLTVHDDKGREYRINNPNYRGRRKYHWAMVKKTIVPTTKVYTWVAD